MHLTYRRLQSTALDESRGYVLPHGANYKCDNELSSAHWMSCTTRWSPFTEHYFSEISNLARDQLYHWSVAKVHGEVLYWIPTSPLPTVNYCETLKSSTREWKIVEPNQRITEVKLSISRVATYPNGMRNKPLGCSIRESNQRFIDIIDWQGHGDHKL